MKLDRILLLQFVCIVVLTLALSAAGSAAIITMGGKFYVLPTPDRDKDGYTLAQGDCNDEDSNIHPGAPEVCGDNIDQDCSGSDLKCIPTVSGSAEGLYIGVTNTNRTVHGIIMDDGTYYVIYSARNNPNLIAGVVQGSSTSSGGVFLSNNAKDFSIEGLGVHSATISGTYSTKQSLSGTVLYNDASAVDFSGIYDNNYEITPSVATIAGTYSGTVAFSLGIEDATVSVSTSGAISGVGTSGCTMSGSIKPSTSGNVYNVSVIFGAAPCYFVNQTMEGIGYYDAETKQLLTAAPNHNRTEGIMFVGVKQ